MSTRADAIALRSLVFLFAALALTLTLRFSTFDFVTRGVAKWQNDSTMVVTETTPMQTPAPQVRERSITPNVRKPATSVIKGDRVTAAVTPIAMTPPRIIRPITRLRVEASRWSAPLHVPAGQRVGIKFSLGRIRVERDGTDAGIVYRNPIVTTNGTRIVLNPLASLDRVPREFWFEKGIRVLRFRSLDKNQSEEVEVLWKK